MSTTADEVPKTDLKKKLDGLGSVTVHFTCCVTTKSFERFIGGQDHNAADVTISAIPEKALKGRAISKCIASVKVELSRSSSIVLTVQKVGRGETYFRCRCACRLPVGS